MMLKMQTLQNYKQLLLENRRARSIRYCSVASRKNAAQKARDQGDGEDLEKAEGEKEEVGGEKSAG